MGAEILVGLKEFGKAYAPATTVALGERPLPERTGVGAAVIIGLAVPVGRSEAAGAGETEPVGNVPDQLQVGH